MIELFLITQKNNGTEVAAVIDSHRDTKQSEHLTMNRVYGMLVEVNNISLASRLELIICHLKLTSTYLRKLFKHLVRLYIVRLLRMIMDNRWALVL